jgi:hypothetical protein
VVIEAELTTNEHGFSSWPTGWIVTARRLNEEGKDDGSGEEIMFYQYFTNGHCDHGLIREVTVVGLMNQIFV